MNSIDLKGRRAVVTGGAQGIGFAVARRFVESGAKVSVWDRDVELGRAAVAELGANAEFREMDQTDLASVEAAAAATEAGIGPVDILVANAGIAGANATLADYDPAEFQRVIQINLVGVFHLNRTLVRGMIDRGYGRIVNVASIAAKEGNPNASAYSASKAGVIALTKSLGKETAGKDIAVNCITPAAARTRIFDQMTQEHIDYMLSKIPRGRFLEVAEAANMVAWLASAENSFTTGAVFDLSGGRATY
ncbi:SDR family NAD(P)-dependent oxidoreductase [Mangrovicoccus algicola]|uniref:SDR family oxidoreductase n=1 Tax=Mangrovicoccus algicola TaxID=2771008 RepID=A0A8J6Z024_9RHOB|nr:SDR family NAD(P)-dependent oxidoreductase [Mangrovicoccus algicola]MBE3639964.1 SDR family oxidoreductase [Mangrovicoccus algicola]